VSIWQQHQDDHDVNMDKFGWVDTAPLWVGDWGEVIGRHLRPWWVGEEQRALHSSAASFPPRQTLK